MEVKSEKISTQELWARLFKSPSVGDYLEKTGDVCEMLAFSEYISQLCKERQEKPENIIKRSDLESSFGHRLFDNVGKVGIQPAAGQQFCVQGIALLLDVPKVTLSPNADRPFFLSRYCKAGDVIVAPQFFSQSIAFVINGLSHYEILLYNSSIDVFALMSQVSECHTLLYPVMV